MSVYSFENSESSILQNNKGGLRDKDKSELLRYSEHSSKEELKHSNLEPEFRRQEAANSNLDPNLRPAGGKIKIIKTQSNNLEKMKKEEVDEDLTQKKFNKTLKNMKFKTNYKDVSNKTPLRLFDSHEILKNMQTQRKDYSKTMKGLEGMIIREDVKDGQSSSS